MSGPVFLIPRLFAKQDDLGMTCPFSEDSLCSPFVEIAAGTGGRGFLQVGTVSLAGMNEAADLAGRRMYYHTMLHEEAAFQDLGAMWIRVIEGQTR